LKYRILDPAVADIETARQYYRDTKYWTLLTQTKKLPDGENELSHAFYEEVKRTVKLVAVNPLASTEVSPGYFRRHLTLHSRIQHSPVSTIQSAVIHPSWTKS